VVHVCQHNLDIEDLFAPTLSSTDSKTAAVIVPVFRADADSRPDLLVPIGSAPSLDLGWSPQAGWPLFSPSFLAAVLFPTTKFLSRLHPVSLHDILGSERMTDLIRDNCQPAVSRPIVIACYTCNVFTDLYLISIPLPMLWSTSMALWKKIGLGILFSGGIVVMVFATIRSVLIVTVRSTCFQIIDATLTDVDSRERRACFRSMGCS
jgi:hypothetical protein